jgi:hypothetical protein
MGACGWPEDRCTVIAHRQTRCRICELPLRHDTCRCAASGTFATPGYSLDPRNSWWVHEGCGWPTAAWLSNRPNAKSCDGTPPGSPVPSHLAQSVNRSGSLFHRP